MQRMLMLQHRSLFGDRPLPLFSADGSHDTAEVGSCSTGTSAWAIQFAAEQANPQAPTGQATAFAAQFQVPTCPQEPGHAQGAHPLTRDTPTSCAGVVARELSTKARGPRRKRSAIYFMSYYFTGGVPARLGGADCNVFRVSSP